jgi:hypothetical protein
VHATAAKKVKSRHIPQLATGWKQQRFNNAVALLLVTSISWFTTDTINNNRQQQTRRINKGVTATA